MPRDTPLVIGLDVGTSAVKAAAFGPGGQAGPVVRRRLPPTVDRSGFVTQPIDGVRAATLDALAAAVRAAPGPVDAVAASTAMHAVAALDAAGRAVTDLVPWADRRAGPVVTDWIRTGSAAFVHDRTGVPLHPMAPLAKLAWFTSDATTRAPGVRRWVDLKALVVQWLTGESVTDHSSASGWGLLDVRSRTWDPDALALAGVDATALPELDAPSASRPLAHDAAAAVGLAAGTPVVLGAADGPLANVGVGAISPVVAGLSLGTSGAVRVVVDEVPARLDGLFCYVLDEQHWVLGGAVSNGANVLDWLGETLGPADLDPTAAALRTQDLAAAAPAGSDGLVCLPYLEGERAPLWDAEVPGAYLGLRRAHTRAHLARAALEGVAAGLGVVVDRIHDLTPVRRVLATGGALVAPLWRQLVAGAMRRPTTVVHVAEGSALGAAAVGLVGLGAAADLTVARELLGQPGDPDAEFAPEPVPDAVAAAAEATRMLLGRRAEELGGVVRAYQI